MSNEDSELQRYLQHMRDSCKPLASDPDPAGTLLRLEKEWRRMYLEGRRWAEEDARRRKALIPRDNDHAKAVALLAKMRLKLSKEDQYKLAEMLSIRRRYVREINGRDDLWAVEPNSEKAKKMAQLRGALSKAMRIHGELFGHFGSDPIPQCEISETSRGSISFSRDKDDDALLYCETVHDRDALNIWPLQIMQHMRDWAAECEAALKQSPNTERHQIQWQLRAVARSCRGKGIKISAAEKSQFYRIARYVAPHISDMKYRIRKLLQEAKRG